MSALESGKAKLGSIISFENLPKDRNDNLWSKLESECGLSLNELSALKTAATGGAFENLIAKQTVSNPKFDSIRSLLRLDSQNEFAKQYVAIGEAICEENEATEFKNLLVELRDNAVKELPGPFIVVDAPSGSGKTQLPFAIQCLGIKVIHIVMTWIHTMQNRQNIYEYLATRSKTYLTAVESDRAALKGRLDMSSMRNWFHPMGTVLLISLEMGVEFTTIQDLLGYVNKTAPEERPVFFLDEVLSGDGESEQTLNDRENVCFLRYVIRCVGLVAVLMGTNTCAASLVPATSTRQSRGSDVVKVWCSVITNLPKVSEKCFPVIGADKLLDDVRSFPALHLFFKEQFQISNPWFVGLIVQCWFQQSRKRVTPQNAIVVLEAVLSRAYDAIGLARNSITDGTKGLRGQFMMFMAKHRDIDTAVADRLAHGQVESMDYEANERKAIKRKVKRHLIVDSNKPEPIDIFANSSEHQVAYHFAKIHEQNNAKLMIQVVEGTSFLYRIAETIEPPTSMTAYTGIFDQLWIPAAKFPSLQSDALMFLLLGGGKDRPAFRSKDGKMSTAELYQMFLLQSQVPSQVADVGNSSALKQDGDLLEPVGCVALCVASHRNGLKGMELDEFLLALANQLSRNGVQYAWGTPSIRVKQKIPFLSPPNDPWPESVIAVARESRGSVADLLREPDRSLIAMFVRSGNSIVFSVEMKHYEEDISLSVFQGILARAFKHSCKVHLILATKFLQSGYYFSNDKKNRVSWKRFSGKHEKYKKTKIWRLVAEEGILSFEMFHRRPSTSFS